MNQQNFSTLITRQTGYYSYYRYVIKAPISEDAANHQLTDPRRGLQRQEFRLERKLKREDER